MNATWLLHYNHTNQFGNRRSQPPRSCGIFRRSTVGVHGGSNSTRRIKGRKCHTPLRIACQLSNELLFRQGSKGGATKCQIANIGTAQTHCAFFFASAKYGSAIFGGQMSAVYCQHVCQNFSRFQGRGEAVKALWVGRREKIL